jgi:teichuronic acid exporter
MKTSVKRASAWAVGEQVARQSVQFVISLILARLLSPADFGLVALVLFFSSLGIALFQTGLATALLRQRDSSAEEESAIFWFALAASFLFGLVLIASGGMIGQWFGQPTIGSLMIAAALQLEAAAIGIIPGTLLNRRFDLKSLTFCGVVASLVSGTLGIVAAFRGAGPWAIALHLVAYQLINSLLLWIITGWRPIPHFKFTTLSRQLRFGAFLSASSVLDVLYTSGFAVIIGKFHTLNDLGLYNRAQGTQQLPGNILGAAVSRIALPLFASRIEDEAEVRRVMRLAIRLSMLLNLPAMAFLAATSPLVLLVLFGPQWVGAAPILAWLCIAGAFTPLHVINLQLLLARERSDLFLAVATHQKLIAVPLIIAGSFFGVIGLAISQAVFALVAFVLNTRQTRASIGYGGAQQLRDLIAVAAIAAMVGVAAWIAMNFWQAPPLAQLALAVALSGMIFAIALLTGQRAFREELALVRARPAT